MDSLTGGTIFLRSDFRFFAWIVADSVFNLAGLALLFVRHGFLCRGVLCHRQAPANWAAPGPWRGADYRNRSVSLASLARYAYRSRRSRDCSLPARVLPEIV